ncbi:hypothetical protein CH063_15959 [Colletotrichum higginsianum]|uniref:Uncharacterized protein n=1 Tax=Colletotrichum higginsianum (strain IMI 349063) TaxID=759273 RepID=H1W594_COLHI|nr:hypothetical protein CH063_15959 [Colletotrichum higginsianum]
MAEGQRATVESVGRANPWFLQTHLFLEFKKFLHPVSICRILSSLRLFFCLSSICVLAPAIFCVCFDRVRKGFGLQMRCSGGVAGEVSPAMVYAWWFSFFLSVYTFLPNKPFSCSVMMVKADLDVLLSVTSIMGHRWLYPAPYSILLPLALYFRPTLWFFSFFFPTPISNVMTNSMMPRLRFLVSSVGCALLCFLSRYCSYMRGLSREMCSQFSFFLAMEKLSSRSAVSSRRGRRGEGLERTGTATGVSAGGDVESVR